MEPYHIFPDLEDCELEQALAAVLSDPPCSSSSDIRDASSSNPTASAEGSCTHEAQEHSHTSREQWRKEDLHILKEAAEYTINYFRGTILKMNPTDFKTKMKEIYQAKAADAHLSVKYSKNPWEYLAKKGRGEDFGKHSQLSPEEREGLLQHFKRYIKEYEKLMERSKEVQEEARRAASDAKRKAPKPLASMPGTGVCEAKRRNCTAGCSPVPVETSMLPSKGKCLAVMPREEIYGAELRHPPQSGLLTIPEERGSTSHHMSDGSALLPSMKDWAKASIHLKAALQMSSNGLRTAGPLEYHFIELEKCATASDTLEEAIVREELQRVVVVPYQTEDLQEGCRLRIQAEHLFVESFTDLDKQLGGSIRTKGELKDGFDFEFKNKHHKFLLAFGDSKLVGILVWRELGPKGIYVSRMAVAEDYKGRLIGAKLLMTLWVSNEERWLGGLVQEYNKKSEAFCRALGAKEWPKEDEFCKEVRSSEYTGADKYEHCFMLPSWSEAIVSSEYLCSAAESLSQVVQNMRIQQEGASP